MLEQNSIQLQEPPDLESRMLQRLQPRRKSQSDIDIYFDSESVPIAQNENKVKDWLWCRWNTHKGEYPQMAAAARDYLAIPASEVAVERLFNKGRDLLAVRRHSMSAETMRMLMLMGDVYSNLN
jgi:hypothetical protein